MTSNQEKGKDINKNFRRSAILKLLLNLQVKPQKNLSSISNETQFMNSNKTIKLFALLLMILAAGGCKNKAKNMEKETTVRIETSMGTIRVKLYNETPLHRDNFIKLAQSGVYNDIIFHRVIRNFMIQTGDPALKAEGKPLSVDTNDYKYTIPAEIIYPRYYHKKGALAAARMGDDVNPNKESSGTQFYIVTGRTFSKGQLMELHTAIYQTKVDELYEKLSHNHMKEMFLMRKKGETEKLQALKDSLQKQAEEEIANNPPAYYTETQKQAYSSVGGAPHLDGEYTVFGEVIEGIEVAEAIERIKTKKDRPIEDIFIKSMTVEE